MSEAAIALPHRAPYTVDDLFELPDDGNRYEVFGGSLVMSPAPAPMHQIIADQLVRTMWSLTRPHGAIPVTGVAVRITEEDGPVPDVSVISVGYAGVSSAVPLAGVHTVVEVVSPSSVLMDRSYKTDLYGEAGIPCYWRVEWKPTRVYRGPLPRVVVRTLDPLRDTEGAAGAVHEFPLAVGPAEWITVALDPATLVEL